MCKVTSTKGWTRNTRNTSLEINHVLTTKMLHDGWKTILTNGVLDNINNPAFKLPSLAHFQLASNFE